MAGTEERVAQFIAGSTLFKAGTPFWLLSLLKFQSDSARAKYAAEFDAPAAEAGAKVILRMFDFVKTIGNAGGLVPEWEGCTVLEFPSPMALRKWLATSNSGLLEKSEMHAFDGAWIGAPSSKAGISFPTPRADVDIAAAAKLAEAKEKDKAKMRAIMGDQQPFMEYVQDDRFASGRIWQLNLLKMEDNPYYQEYGARASKVISSGGTGGTGGIRFSTGSRGVFTLHGDVQYDTIAAMQYPSRNAFLSFVMSQDGGHAPSAIKQDDGGKKQHSGNAMAGGHERHMLRTAGLAVQALICLAPDAADAIRDPAAPELVRSKL